MPRILPCTFEGLPDLEALRQALAAPAARVRAVTLVTPSNPSGAVCGAFHSHQLLSTAIEHGAWLIADEAYEHFVHVGEAHASPAGAGVPASLADGVVSLYTFSKSYGMAGWRVGYLSYPSELHPNLLKVQDTMPTHATMLSQEVAAEALTSLGVGWVREQVSSLAPAREQLWKALQPLLTHRRQLLPHSSATSAAGSLAGASSCVQPRGAFYYMLPLPEGVGEEEAIALLAERYRLLLLPGSAFGAPGTLRLSYGGLREAEEVQRAAAQLTAGVAELLSLKARA